MRIYLLILLLMSIGFSCSKNEKNDSISADENVVRNEETVQPPQGVSVISQFVKRSHTYLVTLPYRLYIPEDYSDEEKYPLVLALQSMGRRGTDGYSHMAYDITYWGKPEIQSKYPCFVVAPQCPTECPDSYPGTNCLWQDDDGFNTMYIPLSVRLKTVNHLLDSLIHEFSIDTTRLYVTGHSMGGIATFNLLTYLPDRFAAAVPSAGHWDLNNPDAAAIIANTPLWICVGEYDSWFVHTSRALVQEIEKLGKQVIYTHCNFKTDSCGVMSNADLNNFVEAGADFFYSEFENVYHNMDVRHLKIDALIDWVFSKRKLD